MCRLLDQPEFPGVKENAKRMLPSMLMLFEGLKRAYEAQAEAEASDDSGEEDSDSEDEDGPGAAELESDEDDIDEEGQVYLEGLQNKINSSVQSIGDGTMKVRRLFTFSLQFGNNGWPNDYCTLLTLKWASIGSQSVSASTVFLARKLIQNEHLGLRFHRVRVRRRL